MTFPLRPPGRHRFSLPQEPGPRAAALSLRMLAVTALALLVAAVAGTFLQSAVFGLEDQESIGHAGPWGYLAGFVLLALMTLPALAGVVLGIRARRLGERRRGSTAVAANVLVAAYLAVPAAAYILFG